MAPHRLSSSNLLFAHLWETFRSKPNAIPVDTKTVLLPTGTTFAVRPEGCSDSQRNGVRLQTGIAFAIDRIPQPTSSTLSRLLLLTVFGYRTLAHNCKHE